MEASSIPSASGNTASGLPLNAFFVKTSNCMKRYRATSPRLPFANRVMNRHHRGKRRTRSSFYLSQIAVKA
jgi:hypothetical protein